VRILYLSSDPGIDVAGSSGGSVHIRSLVRAFAATGNEVKLISSRMSGVPSFGGNSAVTFQEAAIALPNRLLAASIRTANSILGRHPRHSPDLVRLLHNWTFRRAAEPIARAFRPYVVYERYSLWGLSGWRLARQLGVPHVLEVNAPLAFEQQRRSGLTCPRLARRVETFIWRQADIVVTVSETLKQDLERAGASPLKIHVLPNAVDAALFHPDLDPVALRCQLGIDDCFVIGFAGTFKSWHGVDLLLDAFLDLRRNDPNVHLLLIGDGPLKAALEQRVKEAGAEESVTFAGAVAHEEVPQYIAAMDIAVAPAPALHQFYFSPMKLFEYMAVGRPVVAARIGQMSGIVQDGETGLLFPPGDRAGLYGAMRRLRIDDDLRFRLARNAVVAVKNRTWSQNAQEVLTWVVQHSLDRASSTPGVTEVLLRHD